MSISSKQRKVLLVVIDGLGASSLRRALSEGHAPHLKSLVDAGGTLGEAISPFPSLTPVCLATIATGAGPDRHRIPSLGWYSRGQGRFVEYGSSFSASAVEGRMRGVQDVVVDLNHLHLSESTHTIFEQVQDAGLEAGAINYLVTRGRTRHTLKHDYAPVRAIARRANIGPIYGPTYLYFGELYGHSRPRIPQAGIKRPLDWGGGRIARHLLGKTDSAFVLLYLGQHDAASHRFGPDFTQKAIRVADRAVGKTIAASGGIEAFLQQHAILVCADHGQTAVEHTIALEDVFDDVSLFRGSRMHKSSERELAIVASNRIGMAYRTQQSHELRSGSSASPSNEWIAARGGESPATELACFMDNEQRIHVTGHNAKRHGHVIFTPDPVNGTPTRRALERGDDRDKWKVDGDLELLDITVDEGVIEYDEYPDALFRIASALTCVNTGDVLFSAVPGWEYHDIGGGSHTGGSHGSLHKRDSTAPLLTLGFGDTAETYVRGKGAVRLADIAGCVVSELGV